jgi:cell division protease FtsH
MGNQRKNMLIYLAVISVVIAGFFLLFDNGLNSSEEIPMSSLIALTENPPIGQRVNIIVKGDELEVKIGNDNYTSRKEPGSSIYQILQEAEINSANYEVEVEGSSGLGGIFSILLGFLPLILFGGILIFMMRQAQGGANNAMGFGKSKAKRFVGAKATITFADVAGVTEAKQELEEIVEFLKNPERFLALGARIPRGVLLVGPPGTGKTLIARAVAGEAGVPFFSISGSEFVEMFVGVGASRVRDLFEQAKKHSPCIVFVDEIDAVGRHRGAGLGGGHDEREQTLNQILVEMDGFDNSSNVIVLASTNRPDILDPALLRPGRFDRRVVLDNPDISGRKAILEVHSKGKPFEEEVELEKIAKQTPGFSGADLANLVNEAAILAARRGAKKIGLASLVESIDRVIAGPARKSKVISEEEREITAFHEAGHAVVAHNIPAADPVHKVSIISRGQMGGYTRYLPEKDRYLQTKSQFKAYIAAAMGGRVAEKLKFGEITTGASNDIQVATNMAKEMVTTYGMSEKLGLRSYGRKQETIFLGRDGTEQRDYSGKTEEIIDKEINLLLDEGEKEAEKILKKYSDQMENLAKYLLDYETIDEAELVKLLSGEDVTPPLVGETLAHSGDQPNSKANNSEIPPSDTEPQAN